MRLSPIAFLLVLIGLCPPVSQLHAQAPANDAFDSPTVIAGDPSVAIVTSGGSSVNATKEPGEPDHAAVPGGASVWFQWQSTVTGAVEINLEGSAFDSIMAVYTGDTIDDLTPIIFNDDSDHDRGTGVASKVVFNAVAGTDYKIAVDGFPDTAGVAPTGGVFLSLSLASPPVNDAFATPIDLGATIPTSRIADPHLDSTVEPGEPTHGGFIGFGSTWYTWTALTGGSVEISVANGTTRPSLVAVYTGDSLASLDEVATAFSGSAAIIPTDAGTTYRIAVAGLYALGAQTRGDIAINLTRSDARPVDDFGLGQAWRWLHPVDGNDPALADPDFATTWHDPTTAPGYDGPAFNAPSAAPLGYGTIAIAPIVTDIGTPAAGNRYSAYFVREFTLPRPLDLPVLEVLADDGAVIYIDGAEVGRINVTGRDSYTLLADDPIDTETRRFKVAIGALGAGAHTIGVSLHNVGTSSSDLGFDLQLIEGLPFFGDVELGREELCAGFQEPPVSSGLYRGRSGGEELGWIANNGVTIAAADGERAFDITDLSGIRIETERVDVRGRSNVLASIDMRSVDTSSGLEATDFLHAYVEGSYDGLVFQPVADIFAQLTGGEPDPFEAYRSDDEYFTFSTEPGDIPDGLVSVRIVVEGTADSASEHLIIDNLCLELGDTPIRLLGFTATPTGGVSLTVESQAGNLYELQMSADLGRTTAWEYLASDIATGETLTLASPDPISQREMFFRVVNLGED